LFNYFLSIFIEAYLIVNELRKLDLIYYLSIHYPFPEDLLNWIRFAYLFAAKWIYYLIFEAFHAHFIFLNIDK